MGCLVWHVLIRKNDAFGNPRLANGLDIIVYTTILFKSILF